MFGLKKIKSGGFTLIELVMVMIIVAVIAAIGVPLFLSATDSMSFLTIRSDFDQSADVAIARMSREIRRLGSDTRVSSADTSYLSFYDIGNNSISYSRVGTQLMRNSDILATNLSELTFKYYGYDGEISTPVVGSVLTDIRGIEILLTFEIGPYKLYYKTQIAPRNLRHVSYKFK